MTVGVSVVIENKALALDLVSWIADTPRAYAEVMELWRTSCPRLTIWEDAIDLGFVERRLDDGCSIVSVTAAGRAFVAAVREGG